jgi:HEAT repeat protein
MMPPEVDALLGQALNDPSYWRSASATRALQDLDLPTEPVRQTLAGALQHGEERTRRRAVGLLAALALRLGPNTDLLRPALADPSGVVRRAAALAVDEKTSDILPGLLAALVDPDATVREAAAEGLARFPATPARALALSGLLSDPDSVVRQVAAATLGCWGEAAAGAVPGLRAALRDAVEAVRCSVALAVERIGFAARNAEADLIALLEDTRTVRMAALGALGQVGGVAAANALLAVVGDDPSVATALGHIGRRVPDVEARLVQMVRDHPGRRLQGVALALARLDSLAGTVAFQQDLHHERPLVRRRAAEALGWFTSLADLVRPDLERALNDPHARVRQAAVEAVGRFGRSAALLLPGLLRRAHDRSPRVRLAATAALNRLMPEMAESIQTWLHFLADPDRSAARCLRRTLAWPDLPEVVRQEFTAACERRTVWHLRHQGVAPKDGLPPPLSAWEAARGAANQAARKAVRKLPPDRNRERRRLVRTAQTAEHAWQLAWLTTLLLRRELGKSISFRD